MDRKKKDPNRYNDMYDLPHHVSKKYPHMSIKNRAGQFSPFAALTGYGEAITETARFTDHQKNLTEDEMQLIDQALRTALEKHAPIHIRYFLPDDKKEGGSYQEICDKISKWDPMTQEILLEGGKTISIDHIMDAELMDRSMENPTENS